MFETSQGNESEVRNRSALALAWVCDLVRVLSHCGKVVDITLALSMCRFIREHVGELLSLCDIVAGVVEREGYASPATVAKYLAEFERACVVSRTFKFVQGTGLPRQSTASRYEFSDPEGAAAFLDLYFAADGKMTSCTVVEGACCALVVDDLPMARAILARQLTRLGFAVTSATDGSEAMALLQNARPDVIFTDVLMPGMGGRALIENVRSKPATASIPVVAVSVDSSEEMGQDSPFSAYLHKPFTFDDLKRVLAEVAVGAASPDCAFHSTMSRSPLKRI